VAKRIEKYWKIIEAMSDEKLRELMNSFLEKRFGKNVFEDKAYIEVWFARFKDKTYLSYMDPKSRGIFFSLLAEDKK